MDKLFFNPLKIVNTNNYDETDEEIIRQLDNIIENGISIDYGK